MKLSLAAIFGAKPRDAAAAGLLAKPQEKMRKLGRKSKLEKSGDFPLLFRFMEKLMRSHFQNKAQTELVEKRDQLFEKKVAVY